MSENHPSAMLDDASGTHFLAGGLLEAGLGWLAGRGCEPPLLFLVEKLWQKYWASTM